MYGTQLNSLVIYSFFCTLNQKGCFTYMSINQTFKIITPHNIVFVQKVFQTN